MGLLTTYGAHNFVLNGDYNYRCNQVECGEPEVAVDADDSTDPPTTTINIVQWWRAAIEETCSFKYVGMTYETAQTCASSMRSRFTLNKYKWVYGSYITTVSGETLVLYGWHKGTSTPVLESEVRVQKHDNGGMYDVVVNARYTCDNYDKEGSALDLSVKPLLTALQSLPGWSDNPTLTGVHFDAASSSNISIVVAPTKTVEFELVAENILTNDDKGLGELRFTNWYRATTDSKAQVRYEGMTKAAARSLYSSLNSTSGWYFLSHPWEYVYTVDTSGGGTSYVFSWQQMNINQYQCMNEFKSYEEEGGLFTVELTLHVQQVSMTSSPQSFTPPSWPAIWSTKIPGLSDYLT